MIKLVEIQATTLPQVVIKLIETIEIYRGFGFRFVSIENIKVTNGLRTDEVKTVALFVKD